ncbi:flagellar basal body rod protein FlgB [Noviherbaspirillum galbum]|uniref:Flagellar basal body rod protein FlgB n=1 Tax=Noviherbaspirillum galbum TaxID=2709383 RepID=A0A6B3SX34_9BURK|nr:flagellar basal body protein [Noviherbaspirillum galbum]NEX63022.1 flagellar basal body protein [Noviherbaspirillum galbum]
MSDIIPMTTVGLVGLALDAAEARHRAIAHNIANAGTPGFRPLRADFQAHLAQARQELAGAADGASGISASTPSGDAGAILARYRAGLDRLVTRGDGPVALDAEVAGLSENTLQLQALVKALNRHFSILNIAVTEGKR